MVPAGIDDPRARAAGNRPREAGPHPDPSVAPGGRDRGAALRRPRMGSAIRAGHAPPGDPSVTAVRPFRFIAPMPSLELPAARWRDEVRRIEDLGFSTVSVSEHVTGGWAMDPFVA